jgi:hypothetical protein
MSLFLTSEEYNEIEGLYCKESVSIFPELEISDTFSYRTKFPYFAMCAFVHTWLYARLHDTHESFAL